MADWPSLQSDSLDPNDSWFDQYNSLHMLLEALARGDIMAIGRRNGRNPLKQIPSKVWDKDQYDRNSYPDHDSFIVCETSWDYANHKTVQGQKWTDIRLEPEEVIKRWPDNKLLLDTTSPFDFSIFPESLPLHRPVTLSETVSYLAFGRVMNSDNMRIYRHYPKPNLTKEKMLLRDAYSLEFEQRIAPVIGAICDAASLGKLPNTSGIPPVSVAASKEATTRSIVPETAWVDYRIYSELGDCLSRSGEKFAELTSWSQIQFRPSEIKRINIPTELEAYPNHKTSYASEKQQPLRVSTSELKKWISSEVKRAQANGGRLGADAAHRRAKAHFNASGKIVVGRDAWRLLYNQICPPNATNRQGGKPREPRE